MDDKRSRFEALALPHLDAAYNLARWLGSSPADADDIVQEAMLRAFRAFDSLRGSNVKPWLLAIVRNCFLNAKAASGRSGVPLPAEDETTIEDPLIGAAPDPESVAIDADHRQHLAALMASLPREFREALLLREVEDLSYREIATVTNTPIGTVMSRLARARALLKERWLSEVEGAQHET